jgi:hypothetical protein
MSEPEKPKEEILVVILPENLLLKIPDTVTVQLSGRQCRLINWVFTDFLEAATLMPEMPEDLLIACRSIMTFTRLRAENSNDGNIPYPVNINVLQAHFIAFAVTPEAQRRVPDRPDLVELISAIGRGFLMKFGNDEKIG